MFRLVWFWFKLLVETISRTCVKNTQTGFYKYKLMVFSMNKNVKGSASSWRDASSPNNKYEPIEHVNKSGIRTDHGGFL